MKLAIPNTNSQSCSEKKNERNKNRSEFWQVVIGLLLLLIAEIPFECGGRKYNLGKGSSRLFNDSHSLCNGKNRDTD